MEQKIVLMKDGVYRGAATEAEAVDLERSGWTRIPKPTPEQQLEAETAPRGFPDVVQSGDNPPTYVETDGSPLGATDAPEVFS